MNFFRKESPRTLLKLVKPLVQEYFETVYDTASIVIMTMVIMVIMIIMVIMVIMIIMVIMATPQTKMITSE